ncbi:MAG: Na-K-Cl cotransporter [Candidatus Marinimicrobia bacterium]|jgi:amino acid transporter|nr:Na-K-Cl cotransporter [Candidatus Neomarinimicrobiota bacterium]MBT3574434.1 Na-K-Cl cotransporter [Candidatus Neomarinimicrobiota bacterium]MBT4253678.1 Na-K-Cl cotransporter [Candidatus Neomarinimicrobiota bacterium]MBT4480812.1 Na-K-Cl cotransporter [Candidatus Neomarinimicrobiota bacterium]MBT5236223.1 Na-K-Cl cotransporter [Candidatus Neomarinimicrobiota bacterium]
MKKLGTFAGVFTPTILTILGVIMYLRLGWVVGNAGFGGALVIILLAKMITVTTGLSIAAIATNTRVGAGGSYALISRSLGLEAGSAVGIPLYLSQTLGGAMYISGFTEAWIALFPTHDPILTGVSVLVLVLIVSLLGAQFAMRTQYLIMFVIVISLISFFAASGGATPQIVVWGDFPQASFWVVFAIFFPAVTGIEAGAAMSGDLKDSKKSLPLGMLSAIAVSFVVYVVVAYYLDHLADSAALVSNNTIMMDISRWKLAVAAGILGATLSSALGSVVGAPRTLMAMGSDKVIPFFRIFAKRSKAGEPVYSIIFTAVAILVSLILGDLNTIAPLLTMFFLITYATINIAVALQLGIGIPSFRPLFRVHISIPIIGFLWAVIVMFMVNPIFAIVAWLLIITAYLVQVKRGLQAPWGDVRAGMFMAMAEWSARQSEKLKSHPKTWKPNIMVPVEDPLTWKHRMGFLRDIVFPSGTLRLFSVKIAEESMNSVIRSLSNRLFRKGPEVKIDSEEHSTKERQLIELGEPLKAEDLLVTSSLIECRHFLEGISITAQVMRSMYFAPNIMFLSMSNDRSKDERLEDMIAVAVREKMGIAVYSQHPKNALGDQKTLNVWLRRSSPNKDLAILMSIQLNRNWNGQLRFITAVANEEDVKRAKAAQERLFDRARLPISSEAVVLVGNFKEVLPKAPVADLNIFGISNELDGDTMHTLAEAVNTSCLFVKDSGGESMVV